MTFISEKFYTIKLMISLSTCTRQYSILLIRGILLLTTLLTGCKDHYKVNGETSVKSQAHLIDSLKKLDSLVLRYRVTNEELATFYAWNGLHLAQKMNNPEALITALNAIGNAYNASRKDSSFYYYTRAIRVADSCKLLIKKSRIILNLGMIYIESSNFKTATLLIDTTIILAEKYHQPGILADAYNALGLIRLASYDSIGAKKSFEGELEIGKKNQLSRQCGNALANISLFESDPNVSMDMLYKALHYYHGLPGLEEEIALTNINLGNKQYVTDSAISYYQMALKIAEPVALNGVLISAYNNLAYAYLDKKEIRKAENCLETAIPLAMKLSNADWLATLYDTYADVLVEKEQFGKAIIYQKKAYRNRTISDNERSLAQVRLLSTMLDLRTKDILIRQKDIDMQTKTTENRILKLIIAIFFITITALSMILLWFKQRTRLIKTQVQMNAASRIIELEEMEKHRLGFELHDHVGYLVSSISQFIQEYKFSDQVEKEELLEKISNLRSSIRRFSHRLNPINVENEKFLDLVSDLIRDFSTFTGIQVKYFIPASFPELSQKTLLHLIRIIQELLTNASKHANGSNVKLNISATDNTLVMIYKDDGPGFDSTLNVNKGFGFQSINERMRLMGGKNKIVSAPGRGIIWEFEIPFKNL